MNLLLRKVAGNPGMANGYRCRVIDLLGAGFNAISLPVAMGLSVVRDPLLWSGSFLL